MLLFCTNGLLNLFLFCIQLSLPSQPLVHLCESLHHFLYLKNHHQPRRLQMFHYPATTCLVSIRYPSLPILTPPVICHGQLLTHSCPNNPLWKNILLRCSNTLLFSTRDLESGGTVSLVLYNIIILCIL